MTRWRHHLRRARFALTALVAVVLIGAAVFVGLVQVLLPLATKYPDFIANQLSQRLHRPVQFAGISSAWQPSGPLLTVHDLTLGPGPHGGKPITFPHAALKFDFGAWLRPAHRWITLRLNGMALRVEHSAAGWQVVGFGTSEAEAHTSLESLPVDLDLGNLRVDLVDDATGRSWKLLAPRLRVVNVGHSIRFGGSVRQMGTRQAVSVSGRIESATHDYDLYVRTRDLDLADAVSGLDLHGYALAAGHGSLELWGSWRDGKLASAAARYDLRGLAMTGPDGRRLGLDTLAGTLQARRIDTGWNIAWRGPGKLRADIDDAGGAVLQVHQHAGAWRVSGAARDVAVAPWLSVLAMLPQAPRALSGWLAKAQPGARIDTAAWFWEQGGGYDATVRFSDLHAAPAGKIPGLILSSGTLRADAHGASLELPPQAATVALTDVFRKPFVFTNLGGSFVAWREDGRWNIAADALHFDTGELAGNGRARLVWLGGGHRPFLAANVSLEHARANDAKWFWPYRSMPPALVAWLDHAIVDGDVTEGSVLIRGDLDDWPFLDHQGRFEATGVVQDATFDFSDQWPRATNVDAALDFVDNRMGIVATHAVVQGVIATRAVATIPDLGHGVLNLDVQGGGSGAQLLDFVRHSPVGAGALDALRGLAIGGTGKFGIKLSIPLDNAENFSLHGKLDLANADVTAAKWNLSLKRLAGPLVIDGKGFKAQDLTATFRGAPARFSMAVGSDVADPRDIVEAALYTSVSAQTLVQGYPDLASLVAHARGVAAFRIGVKVVSRAGNAPPTPILNVQSSLSGIALDFPAPLDKPADTLLPLSLTLQLPPEGAPLALSLGDVLQVRGRLADPAKKLPTALAVNFGNSVPANVPARGLSVGGHAARLDISGWIQQAMGATTGAAFPQLAHAQIATDDAEVFGTSLGALQFDFTPGARDDTVAFDGTAVKGTLSLPVADLMARGITAKLQRLYWPEPEKAAPSGQGSPPPEASPVSPQDIPPLHVSIGDLRLGNAQLGATTFESAPTPAGMHVDRFESTGADFTIKAQGDWNGTLASSQSRFVADITSRDFGKTLSAFGLSGLLAGGKDSHVHIDGIWPGAPSAFSLAWMDGQLSIRIGEGRILAVKPGLGRVLGLLSLRELPSRLMLHFGDVFKKGFGFDQASANFSLRDGSAYTRDMLITAPAAKIAMHGRIGFRASDYDLTIDVTPHVGGTLPVVGAVIGGPVGAAAGLVVQGLIGKGINKAASSVYQVTGSWDKPVIKTESPAPASATSVAPAATTAPPAGAASATAPSAPAPASAASAAASEPAAAVSAAGSG